MSENSPDAANEIKTARIPACGADNRILPKAKTLNLLLTAYCICIAVGMLFLFLLMFAATGNLGRADGFCFFCLAITLIGFVYAYIFAYVLLYQLWKLIPEDLALTMPPALMVGLCFIPYIGACWWFVAWYGLGRGMNKTLRRYGLQYQVNTILGLLVCILPFAVSLCGMIALAIMIDDLVYVPIFAIFLERFLTIFFLKSVKDGAIALIEQAEQMENASPFCDIIPA